MYINIELIILCSDIYIYIPLGTAGLRLYPNKPPPQQVLYLDTNLLTMFYIIITNNIYYLISISYILSVSDISGLKA